MGVKNVVLVVGAGSGIGLELAKRFSDQDLHLVLVCRTEVSAH